MTESYGSPIFFVKNSGKARRNNAGHERDFYRLSDPVVVEKAFSALEGAVAPTLRSIDQERRWPDNDELDALL